MATSPSRYGVRQDPGTSSVASPICNRRYVHKRILSVATGPAPNLQAFNLLALVAETPQPGLQCLRFPFVLPYGVLELRYYLTAGGQSPFESWFSDLDAAAAAKVSVALVRLGQGNNSNAKAVGEGVLEYRINWGPGYRVYFGRDGNTLVIRPITFGNRFHDAGGRHVVRNAA
jgi:putative addiction module killer protein